MHKYLLCCIALCNLYGAGLIAQDTKTNSCCCTAVKGTDCLVKCLQECECNGQCEERLDSQSACLQDSATIPEKSS
ncbi:MAG: hypothetical protein K2Y01_01160 [Rhabdochlamydiaceae bacterium]|nr:hypothetical protein [Rhabdochlamydiaceae bacterium]